MIFDLAYYIRNIEAGMIAALSKALLKVPLDEDGNPPEGFSADGYVKMIKPYQGELNASSLRQAISGSVKNFPLIFITYVNGQDEEVVTGSVIPGEAITMKRDCRFAVVCCSNDARGTEERQSSTYQMMADTVTTLGNRVIEKQEGSEKVMLTLQPLMPAGDSAITQIPGIWAIAQYFDTYFKYDLKDHRELGPIVINEIIFGITPLNAISGPATGEPGVEAS
jgi:hypothetical protein